MAHFTKEELQELAQFFNLPMPAPQDSLPIRDGYVTKDQMVWWRCSTGPEYVQASKDWDNIQDFPHLYSHVKPSVACVTYMEE